MPEATGGTAPRVAGAPGNEIAVHTNGRHWAGHRAALGALDGVVTERAATVGLSVEPSGALFKAVDLSTVWLVADLPYGPRHFGTKARVQGRA